MTLEDLPELVTVDFLESYGFTVEDVARLCPLAIRRGSAKAPYYHRDDLAPLLDVDGRDGP